MPVGSLGPGDPFQVKSPSPFATVQTVQPQSGSPFIRPALVGKDAITLRFGSRNDLASRLMETMDKLMDVVAESGFMHRVFSGHGRRLRRASDEVNETLQKMGSEYRVTSENLFKIQTLSALFSLPSPGLNQPMMFTLFQRLSLKLPENQKSLIPVLLETKGLPHPDPAVRRASIRELLKHGTEPQQFTALMNRLGVEDDETVIKDLETTVLSLAKKEHLDDFITSLYLGNQALRRVGIQGINKSYQPKAMPHLLKLLGEETDPTLGRVIQTIIQSHPTDVPVSHWQKVLSSSNTLVLETAVSALGGQKVTDAFAELHQRYSDLSAAAPPSNLITPNLETVFRTAMANQYTPTHQNLLVAALSHPAESVQQSALDILMMHPAPDLVAPLFEYLESPQAKCSEAALDLLGELGEAIDHGHLVEMLDSPKPALQLLGAKGLGKLKQLEDLPVLLNKLEAITQAPASSKPSKDDKATPLEQALRQSIAGFTKNEDALAPIQERLFETANPKVANLLLEVFSKQVIEKQDSELAIGLFDYLEKAQTEAKGEGPKAATWASLAEAAESTLETILTKLSSQQPRRDANKTAPPSKQPAMLQEAKTQYQALLIRALESVSVKLQKQSLGILKELPKAKLPADLVPRLLTYAEAPECPAPQEAIDVLKEHLMAYSESHLALIKEKLSSRIPELRALAASIAVLRMGVSNLPEMMAFVVQEQVSTVRAPYLDVISTKSKDPSAFSILVEIINENENQDIQQLAVQQLVHHGTKALNPLFKLLARTDAASSLHLEKEIERAVVKLSKVDEAYPILINELRGSNHVDVRRVAAMGLVEFVNRWAKAKPRRQKDIQYDNPDLMTPLREFAQQQEPHLQEAAGQLLARFVEEKITKLQNLGTRGAYHNEDHFEMLRELIQDAPEPEVREAAQAAFDKLNDRRVQNRMRRIPL
jgi:hypothetical protein